MEEAAGINIGASSSATAEPGEGKSGSTTTACYGNSSPDGPAEMNAPSIMDAPSSASAGAQLTTPLNAATASAAPTSTAAPALHAPPPPPATSGAGGLFPATSLVSVCSHKACAAPGATSSMLYCGACRSVPYCSARCLENHARDHRVACRLFQRELVAREVLGEHVHPSCRILPPGNSVASAAAGDTGNTNSGNNSGNTADDNNNATPNPNLDQSQIPAPPPPPINAVCYLCRNGTTTIDANRYRLVHAGCDHCRHNPSQVGYVHPTCLVRHAREVGNMVLEVELESDDDEDDEDDEDDDGEEESYVDDDDDSNSNSDSSAAAARQKARANKTESRRRLRCLDYRFLDPYTTCRHCDTTFVGGLANALTDLAVRDSEAYYPGPNANTISNSDTASTSNTNQAQQKGTSNANSKDASRLLVWSAARVWHATNLMRVGRYLGDMYRRRQRAVEMAARAEMAEAAKAKAETEAEEKKDEDASSGGGEKRKREEGDDKNGDDDDDDNGDDDGASEQDKDDDDDDDDTFVPSQMVQAEDLLRQVLDVLGTEADDTDLDEHRMSALFQLGQIHRIRRKYESAIDYTEQCMDVVATTIGRDGFAARYRDLAARAITQLNVQLGEQNGIEGGGVADMLGEAYSEDKPFDVQVAEGGDDDRSQVSDLSRRSRSDHYTHHHRANENANADEEESLDHNQTVAIVTVNDELYLENTEGGVDEGNGVDEDNGDGDGDNNNEDSDSAYSPDDVPMDEVRVANTNTNATDEALREYEEARSREPVQSEAYMQYTLAMVEIQAMDGRYVEALANLDMLRDISRVFGDAYPTSKNIVATRDRLQKAEHTDWVPELPSLGALMDKVRAAQEEYGVDSIESFRAQIYVAAKHVQSSQVDLGMRMICTLRERAGAVLGEDHELTRGNNGVLANIRDRLAFRDHPWLEKATDAFTGVTIAGSGRSAIVVNDIVAFEWTESGDKVILALPIWGGAEDGMTITFQEENIVFGGSESGRVKLLGQIDTQASLWRIERGAQINNIPGSSSLIATLIKKKPGQPWKLPCDVNLPEPFFNKLMAATNDEESNDNDNDDDDEELAAVN